MVGGFCLGLVVFCGVGIIYLSDGCGWIYAGLRCVIVGLGWWCFLVVVAILGCVYVF